MIVEDKSEVRPSEVGCFPDLDAIWNTFPRSTRLHMLRVGRYADAMYQYMAQANLQNVNDCLGDGFRAVSKQIFTLHDIGRHYIPFALLNKVGDLTQKELQIIRDHTVNARRAMKSIYKVPYSEEIMKNWEDVAVHHHERFDGKGYPDGLSGTDIPLGARICAIADTYDGIVSWKAYKKKQTTRDEAVAIIESEAGKQFQPELVAIFKECIMENK